MPFVGLEESQDNSGSTWHYGMAFRVQVFLGRTV